MLENVGWAWQEQNGCWERKPDLWEEIPLTTIKLRLEIPPLPEDLQTIVLKPSDLENLRRLRKD